jgi:hypothetical protein
VLVFNFLDTAYSCADNDTGTKNVFFGKIKAAVIHSLLRRCHSKLRKAVHSLALALVNVFGYFEISYLTPELDWVCTGIE